MLLFRSYLACIKRKIAVYRFIPKRQKIGAEKKYKSGGAKERKRKEYIDIKMHIQIYRKEYIYR